MNDSQIKGVALNPNSHIQLTDHLVPICAWMDIPLLLTNENYAHEIKNYYPPIAISLVPWEEITPEYLIQNYHFFVQSEYWNRKQFYSTFSELEKKYKKTVRNIHCPHGFSDKYRWFNKAVWEDILFVYGNNLLDMFKGMNIDQNLNAYIRTGNYRYAYYLKNKDFFDALADKEIWKKFSTQQPTLLYAPSWNMEDDNPSIYGASDTLLQQLPPDYNLLFKIHPLQEHFDAPHLYRLMGKYESKGNVLFVKDFPVIYPILARSQIYIGDMSAIGYDFLTFNRPMFFLNQKKFDSQTDRRTYLFQCGIEILPDDYSNFYSILEEGLKKEKESLFTKIREQVYEFTFGTFPGEEQLRKDILASYSLQKKFD